MNTGKLNTIRLLIAAMTVAMTAVFCVSCDEDSEANITGSGKSRQDELGPKEPTAKYQELEKPYKYELAGMDGLVNKYGIRRKVIITRDGVRCSDEPGSASRNGQIAKFYNVYFVFDIWPENAQEGEVQAFQIGPEPRKSSTTGWISRMDCIPWDYRVGASWNGRPLLVFETKEDLIEYLETGIPDKAVARTTLNTEWRPNPWPITKTFNHDHRNRSIQLNEINFLGAFSMDADLSATEFMSPDFASSGNSSGLTDDQKKEIRESVRHLDLVFVSDTTCSMTPYILQVKEAVRNIVNEVSGVKFNADVAFRFVEYRDYVNGLYFDKKTRRVYNEHPYSGGFLPAYQFLQCINPVNAADVGSDGLPEAVFDGVNAALTNTDWRGILSHRVIILMGDDSSHPVGHSRNPRGFSLGDLISLAKDQGIKIFSLMAPCRGGDDEKQLHGIQFSSLAKETGGKCYPLEDALKVVPYIDTILGTERATVGDNVKAADTVAKVYRGLDRIPRQDEIRRDVPADEQTVVLEFIKTMASRGITPNMLAPGETAFCSGWVASEVDSIPQHDRKIFIAKKELAFLLRDLITITLMLGQAEDGEGKPMQEDAILKAMGLSFGTRVGETDRFADVFNALSIDNQEPEGYISAYYSSIGVPGNGMFNMTKDDLMHMPSTQKDRISTELGLIMPEIAKDLSDNDIFPFYGTGVKFGWVPEEHIP